MGILVLHIISAMEAMDETSFDLHSDSDEVE
jgi:hypothetical protein